MKHLPDIPFEESLNDDWGRDLDMVEVPFGNRSLRMLSIVVLVVVLAVFGKVVYLNLFQGGHYVARAANNASLSRETPAPRGIIYDREGQPLVENKGVFTALINERTFITNPSLQSSTIAAAENVLGLSSSTVWAKINASEKQKFATPIVLSSDLTHAQLVNLQALALPTIAIRSSFIRVYPQGQYFSSVVGYVGQPTAKDLATNPKLIPGELVGRAGIEEYYDSTLQGTPGVSVEFRNARGKVLGVQQESAPTIGKSIHLTIDGGLQKVLYNDIQDELNYLYTFQHAQREGVGLAINPNNGQILALVNVPGYNNNLFSNPASNTAEINALFTSPAEPMFNRVVAGQYNPGSTIKPLVATAALADGVINSTRQLYSPGYLMVPNKYDPSHPTKYLDWEWHGYVNLAQALAQSSDVYFYIVGGGSPATTTPLINNPVDYGIGGLGIDRLHQWWKKFGLGTTTGIDLPGEQSGFLPTPAWWKKVSGKQWLTGDTYNVSIGQGNLLLTPIQLLSYIGAIANGGTIWRPYLNASSTPHVNENLTSLAPEIAKVQQGMVEGVSTPRGTSYTLHNLPIQICAKTGSAQIKNNTEENALFVGYAPCNHPKIVLLVLIQNANQDAGLNTVPEAGKVLLWYYKNRLLPHAGTNSSGTASSSKP